MMKRTIAGVAGLCFMASAAAADEPLPTIPVDADPAAQLSRDKALPYSYAGLGYFHTEYDSDLGQDGYAVEGSFQFLPNFFATGTYFTGETDEVPGLGAIDVTQLNVGVGYRFPLSMTADLVGSVEFVEAELEAAGAADSESGYEVDVGFRGLLIDRLEGKGELQYLDIGEEAETYFNLQALYAVLPQARIGIDLLEGDNQTSYGLIGRFTF